MYCLLHPALEEVIQGFPFCCAWFIQYFQLQDPVIFKIDRKQVVPQNYVIQFVPANQPFGKGAREGNSGGIHFYIRGLENAVFHPAYIGQACAYEEQQQGGNRVQVGKKVQTAGKADQRFYHPGYGIGLGKFPKLSHGKRKADTGDPYYKKEHCQEPVWLRTAVNTNRIKQEQYAGKPMHYR